MPISQGRALARVFGNDAAELRPSHLGKGVIVQGRLDAEGEIHVHGVVLGRIHAGRLVLAVDGYIEGDVVAPGSTHRRSPQRARLRAQGRARQHRHHYRTNFSSRGYTVARGAVIDGRMPWRPLNFFESLEQLPEKQP